MITWLKGLFKHTKHKWETTHTNRWMHPTRQVCEKCGLARSFVFIDGKVKGMPWERGQWVDDNGDTYSYDNWD